MAWLPVQCVTQLVQKTTLPTRSELCEGQTTHLSLAPIARWTPTLTVNSKRSVINGYTGSKFWEGIL